MADDPSALIVPFGKHQGLTVAELLERDPNYAQWLLSQNWLAQRFAQLHAAIVTRGAIPDDSPEHNQIQARFLDPAFHTACLVAAALGQLNYVKTKTHDIIAERRKELLHSHRQRLIDNKDTIDRYQNASGGWTAKMRDQCIAAIPTYQQNLANAEAEILKPLPPIETCVSFEQDGIDVIVQWNFTGDRRYFDETLKIEIKPSLGDDYPSVMRQMSRLGARVLVIDQYASSNLTLSTVREMFKANGQILLTIQDILDQIPDAKNFMGNSA